MILKTTPAHLLPINRIIEYRKFSNLSAAPVIDGVAFRVPESRFYQANFDQFRQVYFRHTEASTEWSSSGKPEGGAILKASSDGYKAFRMYAYTPYGAAMIRHMLDHRQDRYPDFIISQGSADDARGEYVESINQSRLFLPKKFPSLPNFLTTNQPVLALGIIHHEFYHTGVWQRIGNRNGTRRDPDNSKNNKHATIFNERHAVIRAENPVRLFHGHEPRYCYYRNNEHETINIVTAKVLPGQLTVNKYDIRTLVPKTHKDALK